MFCIKCGAALEEGSQFCGMCGTAVQPVMPSAQPVPVVENPVSQPVPVIAPNTNPEPVVVPAVNTNVIQPNLVGSVPTQGEGLTNNAPVPSAPKGVKKSSKILIIVIIVMAVIILPIIAIVGVMVFSYNHYDRLVCKSKEGNITLLYSEEGIVGYTASGITYDEEQGKAYAKKIGINSYIVEFNQWFIENTTGSCEIVLKDGGKGVIEEKPTSDTVSNGIKVIGDAKYGYLDVPDSWVVFQDVDETTSLQYSYAGVYIVSLDYFEGTQYTAKDYAENYARNMQSSSEVTGLTGATVTIGKDKVYTAYQVYMYYPADSTFLVTYWFSTEDGVVRYIALEGPEKLDEEHSMEAYLSIPESFHLTK